MFVKIMSLETAKGLAALGFKYVLETVNGDTIYCFEQSPELAATIMNNYAVERLCVDNHLRF